MKLTLEFVPVISLDGMYAKWEPSEKIIHRVYRTFLIMISVIRSALARVASSMAVY
jgi:hypothetical protein